MISCARTVVRLSALHIGSFYPRKYTWYYISFRG